MNTPAHQKVLGVIPARIGSVRVPQKMLKDIAGKTLIRRTYERSMVAKKLDALVVATDSDEIEREAESFGATVIRSVKQHNNGTERAAEAARLFKDFSADIVVAIWGDEPLYPASVIDDSVSFLSNNPSFDAALPSFKIESIAMVQNSSVGKVVADVHGRILYLSRSVVPHNFKNIPVDYYHASGAFALRRPLLEVYASLPRAGLEAVEDIEQLRVLEQGYSIGTFKTDFLNHGVNTPEDYETVVRIYRERGE